jgi:DNA-binding NarL/FixJ family response regulator
MQATTQRQRTDVITVSVIADDQITAAGAVWHLGGTGRIRCVPADARPDADVVVVFAGTLGDALLIRLGEIAAEAAEAGNAEQRMVVVSELPKPGDVIKAMRHGMVGFVPRREATPEAIADAVSSSAAGRAMLPGCMVRWVIDHNRRLERDIRAGWGIMPGGLTARELELVQLLAEGRSTLEIGEKLSYAERTVKKIIHQLLMRLELRNRAHLVAYAARVGAI